MSMETILHSARELFSALAEVALRSTPLLVLSALALLPWGWLDRRWTASQRSFTGAAALALAVALPILWAGLPRWTVPLSTARPAVAQAASGALETGARARTGATHSVARGAAPSTLTHVAPPAMAVWLLGVLWVIARGLRARLALARWSRRTRPVHDERRRAVFVDLATRLNVRRHVRLVEGAALEPDASSTQSPMTWGALRPVIYLPSDSAGWTLARLRVVLAHELAHVARRDSLLHPLMLVACAVYWFNPLVWWVVARLRVLREQACDDAVLGLGVRPSDYAEELLTLARALLDGPAVREPAMAIARRSSLARRLHAILDSGQPRGVVGLGFASAVATLALALATPLALLEPVSVVEHAAVSSADAGKAGAVGDAGGAAGAEAPEKQEPARPLKLFLRPGAQVMVDAQRSELRVEGPAVPIEQRGRTILVMAGEGVVEVHARDGRAWRFTVEGAPQNIEHSGVLTLRVGERRTLAVPGLARVSLGDDEVADVKVLGRDNLELDARGLGKTTLIVWQADGSRRSWVVRVGAR